MQRKELKGEMSVKIIEGVGFTVNRVTLSWEALLNKGNL